MMDSEKRTRNEYGGFLPLELNCGEEFFAKYESFLLRFNSVKAALSYLLERLACKRMYIPYYYCPTTIRAIKSTGVEVCFYHVDDNLLPRDVLDEENSCVLLVDYFGVRSEQIDAIAKTYKLAEVIIDRAHAFYAVPIINQRIHNVYSARKFFGVSDGAYLISTDIVPFVQIPTEAYPYAGYLFLTYEEGTNAAYTMKKEADKMIADNYGCMSKLAIGLLQNVDYKRVARRRRDNYRALHAAFREINQLELPDECIPYQYPLLICGYGNVIKQKLIGDRIFVSTLWSGEDLLNHGNMFELDMSRHCVFLPIDQRYDEQDMEYIVERVKVFMNENS